MRVADICGYSGIINASLAVFNMLPGFPLDGGRVLRAVVWSRNKNRLQATDTAARSGEWIAYGIMGIGVLESVLVSPFSGIWFLLIGFALKNAGRRQLRAARRRNDASAASLCAT